MLQRLPLTSSLRDGVTGQSAIPKTDILDLIDPLAQILCLLNNRLPDPSALLLKIYQPCHFSDFFG